MVVAGRGAADGASYACSRRKTSRFCAPSCFKKAWKAHKPTCQASLEQEGLTFAAAAPAEQDRVHAAANGAKAPAEAAPKLAATPTLTGVGTIANGCGASADGRIFISIAAYCDPELSSTLQSLLLHCESPSALYVGLVWQGDGDPLTADELKDLARLWGESPSSSTGGMLPLPGRRQIHWDKLLNGRIRLVRLCAEEARGPCWARYLAQLLWRGEELQLQLDSHMRFVPQWDRLMRQELAWCARSSAKPVLCSYGRGYKLGMPADWVPPGDLSPCLNCAGFFDDNNILNIRYRSLKSNWLHPQKSFFWSAHFAFSSSEVLREVPYDPHLQMLFYGEEILMTVRLFTHGWDLYAPSRGLLYHLWERDYRRVYFFDLKQLYSELAKPSRRRLHGLLGSGPRPFFDEVTEAWPLPGDKIQRRHTSDPFGLGSERTVKDYEDEADVDFKARQLGAFALRGGAPSEGDFLVQETGDQAEVEARCRQLNSCSAKIAGKGATDGDSDNSADNAN